MDLPRAAKTIFCLFLFLMAFSGTFSRFGFEVKTVKATITGVQPPASGTWIINQDTTVENENLTLNGNVGIRVDSPYTLTITNSTIWMNLISEYGAKIEIKSGATIKVLSSKISNITQYSYNFEVYSKIITDNAEIYGAGSLDFTQWDLYHKGHGLFINSDGSILNNTYVYYGKGTSIVLYNSKDLWFENVTCEKSLYVTNQEPVQSEPQNITITDFKCTGITLDPESYGYHLKKIRGKGGSYLFYGHDHVIEDARPFSDEYGFSPTFRGNSYNIIFKNFNTTSWGIGYGETDYVHNITIQDGLVHKGMCVIQGNAHDNIVRNVTFHKPDGDAFRTDQWAHNNLIENCTVYGGLYGFYDEDRAYNNTYRNLRAYDMTSGAMGCQNLVSGWIFENNLIENVGLGIDISVNDPGTICSGPHDGIIRNNTLIGESIILHKNPYNITIYWNNVTNAVPISLDDNATLITVINWLGVSFSKTADWAGNATLKYFDKSKWSGEISIFMDADTNFNVVVTSWDFKSGELTATLSTPAEVTGTIQIHIPSDIPFSIDTWEVSCTEPSWGKTWDEASRTLTVWVVSDGELTVTISGKGPPGVFGTEVYYGATIAVGSGVAVAWWYQRKKKTGAIKV